MAEGKNAAVVGSTIKLIHQQNGWKVEVLHGDGGVTGRLAPFTGFDEAVTYIKERYTLD